MLLKPRRMEANLSQKELADAVGLSRASITNIERGRQPVSLPSLYVMANILEVDVSDLLPPIGSQTLIRPPVIAKLKHVSSKESNWLTKLAEPRPLKTGNAKT